MVKMIEENKVRKYLKNRVPNECFFIHSFKKK